MKKKKDVPIIVASVILCLFIISGVWIAILVLNTGEVQKSEDITTEKREVLYCQSSSPKDTFFTTPYDVSNLVYEVKFIFEGKNANSASYAYDATFLSNENAKKQASKMHWDYNEYMATTSVHQEALTPIFNNYENKVRAGLYFEKKNLTSEMAKLLFLNDGEAEALENYSVSELSKLYKNKNFSCKIRDFND